MNFCFESLPQQIAAVYESFARQRAIHFRISPVAGRKALGIATRHIRLMGPVDRGEIDIVAKPQVSLVVHEHGEQKNDRQRDSDQPEQSTLSERHVDLHLM